MNFKKLSSILLLIFSFNLAFANSSMERIYTGPVAIGTGQTVEHEFSSGQSRENIRIYLELESRVQKVSEAINLKTQALRYVEDLSDFEYLTSTPFANPSEAYKDAVGEFIARYIGGYVRDPQELRWLSVIENRVTKVNQAMAVKQAGVRAAHDVRDFLLIVPPAVGNPSEAYLKAISEFAGQYVRLSLNAYSPIYLIIDVERYTKYVSDAISVKQAGLVAVHSKRDLLALAEFCVSNPSEAYRQAVNDFIRNNINNYP